MGVISGYGGATDAGGSVGQWRAQHSADIQEVINSATKGAAMVLDGNKDWSGSFEQDLGQPSLMPGETSEPIKLSIDGSIGLAGNIITDQIQLEVDIEGGAPIKCTTNFSGNGALTIGAAVAADATSPDPPSSVERALHLAAVAAAPSYAALTDVRKVTLTLQTDNQAYVSSSTAGANKRVKGNLKGTISIAVYASDLSTLPAPNTAKGVKIYVTATEFWLVEWVKFGDLTDILINRRTNEPVGATLNGQFSAYHTDGSAIKEGQIVLPDTTAYWPFS